MHTQVNQYYQKLLVGGTGMFSDVNVVKKILGLCKKVLVEVYTVILLK